VLTIAGEGDFGDENPRKIQPSPNDTPDTHIVYEDRAFGGAGLDILIGNTGGDRLIDWTGEYNSYIVPFAPFGIATVSRQVPPGLFDFLWAQAASDGVDLTRSADIGTQISGSRYSNVAALQAEPFGEMGLVTQKDRGLWQDQTGGPTDPQPGNIPGGARDVLRTADFNDGDAAAFAVDEGQWSVQQGQLTSSPSVSSQQAAGVFYLDDYLPIYYELEAYVSAEKPTGGAKANAYVIFDYFSPTDFKYAGINISNNKIEMGYRDDSGWHEVVQSNKPVKIKPERLYDVLVAVNGTHVTVSVAGVNWFSHTFAPRILDGEEVGLNKGLVGLASHESTTTYDNFKVQILPPELTLDHTEDFSDGTADLFTGSQSGSWSVTGSGKKQRYEGSVGPGETGWSTVDLGTTLEASSYLELQATLDTTGVGGLIFDRYGDDDFKFIALDVDNDRIIVGHQDGRRGWVVDQAFARSLDAGVDYDLKVVLKGASVSVQVDGSMVGSWGYNAAVVDGGMGVLTRDGTSSFDEVRIRTNDPAFAGDSLLAASMAAAPSATAVPVTVADAAAMLDAARANLAASGAVEAAALESIMSFDRLAVVDLPGLVLARSEQGRIEVDVDAAGHGWFVDPTPATDEEFTPTLDGDLAATADSEADGRMDLLTAVTHELGHVAGLDHDSTAPFMATSLEPGQRLSSSAPTASTQEKTAVRAAAPAAREQLFDDARGALLSVDEARLLWRLGEEARREANAFAAMDDEFLLDGPDDPDADDNAPAPPAPANGTELGGDGTSALFTDDDEAAAAAGTKGGLIDWGARSSVVDRASGLTSLLGK